LKELFHELLKRTPIVYLTIGVILLLFGAAGGITTSFISLLISDFAGRVTTVVIGVALIVFGTFLAWREFVRSQHESKADVKVMKSAEELYKYVKMRIEQARERVDDLTWGPPTMELTTFADKQAFDDYVETIGAICRKETIAYREVMSFPPIEHIDVRIKRAEMMLKQNLFGYHLRYYQFSADEVPPLLSFLIVDSEEVILALYRYPYMPIEGKVRLAVRNPDIVSLFQDYYNAIWHGAKVLKEGDKVDWKAFEEIQKWLETHRKIKV